MSLLAGLQGNTVPDVAAPSLLDRFFLSPRAIFTTVVDSIALRHALQAPKADAVGSKALSGGGGSGSMRFKGLTLRSKGMHGVNVPKLGVQGGVNRVRRPRLPPQDRARSLLTAGLRDQVVVGMAKGSALDSWDIAHALGTFLYPSWVFVAD